MEDAQEEVSMDVPLVNLVHYEDVVPRQERVGLQLPQQKTWEERGRGRGGGRERGEGGLLEYEEDGLHWTFSEEENLRNWRFATLETNLTIE